MINLPNVKKPCSNCPFRKDSLKGWLGSRMEDYVSAQSFVCHKKTTLQCAGHMLLNGTDNGFVRLANRLGLEIQLSGRELVFDTRDDCIAHHASESNELSVIKNHQRYRNTKTNQA